MTAATAAAVRRGVTPAGVIWEAALGGRRLWYPSAAERAALAACRADAAAMAALRTAVAEQVGGYQTLLAQNNCVGVGGGRMHGGKVKTR